MVITNTLTFVTKREIRGFRKKHVSPDFSFQKFGFHEKAMQVIKKKIDKDFGVDQCLPG